MAQELFFVPWLVWALPILGAVLTPAFAFIRARVRDYAAVGFAFISAALAALLLPTALAGETIHHQVPWIAPLGLTAGVLADPLSILMANVVGWISFLIMVYSLGYMKGERDLARYWFFMNFFIGNMQLIVLADNLLQLFVGWELVGLCSYALIGFWHSDEQKYWVGTPGHKAWGLAQAYSPSHAGFKAFVTTRIGDVSFLIGLLILFFAAGTFDFTKLSEDTAWARDLAQAGLFVPVGVLIFGGAIGKSAQFPLHEWLPDAMAGPTAVSALIHAATMVKAGVFLVARTGPLFFHAAEAAQQAAPLFTTIAWIGAFTAFLAATQAMAAKEVKKVLAYSTVSQIGYMMLALGVAGLAVEFVEGFTAGFFHLTSHAIFKAAMFMAAGALIHATGSKYMHEMGGLRPHMRITFLAMLLAAFSLSGVPPLSGFWSKDAVLAVTAGSGQVGLFLVGAVTAIITAFYSFRMLGLIFFGRKSQHLEHLEGQGRHVHEAPAVMWVPYLVLAAASVAIGVVGPFFEESLRRVLGQYLATSFEIEAHPAAFTLNPLALTGSLVAVGLGGYIGYHYYIAQRADPARVLARSGLMRGVYGFLENRWYIDALYYKVFVVGMLHGAQALFKWVETGVIDRFNAAGALGGVGASRASDRFDVRVVDGFINGLARAGQAFSGTMRRVQTGITQSYAFAFAIGIVFLVIVMLLFA